MLLLIGRVGHAQNSFGKEFTYPLSIHALAKVAQVDSTNYTLQEILKNENSLDFKSLENPITNLGFTDQTFWLRFSLTNDSDQSQTLYLETARPITDVVHLYQLSQGEIVTDQLSGDMIKFKDRPFKHRKLIFPITIASHSTSDFYIKYQSDGEVISIPLLLNDTSSLVHSSFFTQLIYGIFYGVLFLAGVTYLFFYFAMKEASFIFYVAYVASIALLHMNLDGYFFQYVTQEPGWFANRSLLIFAALSSLALGVYSFVYLKAGKLSKVLKTSFELLFLAHVILLLGILTYSSGQALYYPAVNGLGFLMLILIIFTIFKSYLSKSNVDFFFTIGIACLTIGFVIFILNNFSLIPNSFFTANASKIGTGAEIIFLSLSMANRIRLLKTEKEEIQEIALMRAEESNDMKSYFLSNMSHELRTPLNAILGLSKSILSNTDDPAIKNNLEVIQYSSMSLLGSINDILDYSKIEKGELNLAHVHFDLHKIIQELKVLTNQKSREKGLEFIYEERNPISTKLVGDPIRLKQIISNVLDNATKFTQKGQVKLTVNTEEKRGNKLALTVDIEDTGVGIAKEKLNQIFDSFSQEQLNDKRKYGGFGIGLCIVKALVDLHHGVIEVKSVKNEGTQVKIKIELEKSSSAPNKQELMTPTQVAKLMSGKHFLVVEDNTVNQLVIKSILKKWKGVSFDFANHGLEALEALKTKAYDVVLMDLQMPEMDGYEATELIRSGNSGMNSKDIPIIAVTADTTEKTKARVFAIGMDDYITKPIDQELLYSSVEKALYLEKIKLDIDL
ncbi:7TM diverse intracellular signaling domain-containing protein [Algoriphagus sp. C2-6-M1]|uniref:hybrid sensor histidine kinase/response regulator n=1 Tax=Algoriphagus persicinus TaxID=3108754 RepID=UPI002B381344|nr:7TM diverse intracellular signaling domain-containing protein [Algoriphagus sp. C2-6-M1]MEB2780525.1 7TM diverse intracellular signaling domain-containing protein [Algoriphagus sp. C2-6-M1]